MVKTNKIIIIIKKKGISYLLLLLRDDCPCDLINFRPKTNPVHDRVDFPVYTHYSALFPYVTTTHSFVRHHCRFLVFV